MTTYLELIGLFVLLMLPLLYETNHVFRYYFKFIIYYGIVSLNSIVLIPAFLCRPCDVRNLLLASAFCHRISTLISLRWELRGKEHLEKEQACIIVANHQSSLDILGMFDIWPIMNKCTVVAKRELFYAGPFGLAAWLAGLIFIDRVRGEKARDTLNAVNNRIKKDKIKIWIFPEGTRRNTGEIHPFKKGAFHMAINEQIPIIPVVFSSYCTFLNDRKKILNAGEIIITALPAIETQGLSIDDLPKLMEQVHKQMSDTFKHSSAEILQSRGVKTTMAVTSSERQQPDQQQQQQPCINLLASPLVKPSAVTTNIYQSTDASTPTRSPIATSAIPLLAEESSVYSSKTSGVVTNPSTL